MRKSAMILLLLLAPLLAYLLMAPVPVQPLPWQAMPDAGYSGAHQANQKLSKLKLLDMHGEVGPEHIALGPDGKLYVTSESGRILRMQADGSQFEVFAETGGRPLGLDFDAQGRVIVADAMQGLLAIGPDRKITVLLDKLTPPDGAPPDGSPPDGSPPDNIRYANSVVVAKNGKIYLSDASQRFAPRQFGGTFHASILDILEHSATGRVIEFDPASAKARVVFKDLAFANGLALSQDEKSLFVVETGEYRVWKLDLQAQNLSARQNSPMAHLLLANLPGYPDNLMRGREGRIWLGLAKPRAGAIDNMAQRPWLRKVTLRLPKFLWPVPKAYGHVIAFHEDGKIVQDMQDPAGAYPETTGVLEAGNQLFIQSLHAHAIGWLPDSVMLGSGK